MDRWTTLTTSSSSSSSSSSSLAYQDSGQPPARAKRGNATRIDSRHRLRRRDSAAKQNPSRLNLTAVAAVFVRQKKSIRYDG